MKKEITNWRLKGFWQNELPMVGYNIDAWLGVTDWMDAVVPGGVHQDLIKNGIIKDPYQDRNSLDCEWVEHKWWAYRSEFDLPSLTGEELFLVFLGIDYKATVLINGHKAADLCGMYRTFYVPITQYAKFGETNTLTVVFEDAPQDGATYGYTSHSNLQKSRFNYKWDFSTRLVNIGLYDKVFLQSTHSCLLKHWHLNPVLTNERWQLNTSLELESFRETDVSICYSFDGYQTIKEYHLQKGTQIIDFSLDAGHPKLWWPNGHGEQNLYTFSVTISDPDGFCDSREQAVGFRTLSYCQTQGATVNALPYNAVINGKRIYLKGVNFVPLDHLYGCVSQERYKFYLQKAHDANINTIRVWGGGVIEKEIFYQLCDELGIMVWQDFIQSSSGGFADFPSKDPEFMELLKTTSIFAVKEKRNHVCLTYWCGGNELTDDRFPGHERHPVTYDDKNIAMLKQVVDTYDAERLMLPSTGSGPHMCLGIGMQGETHDVHGPWCHTGFQAHYELLNQSTSMLHSEMGTDGMSCLDSIKKFLSPEYIGAHTAADNLPWRHHTYWDTYATREKLWLGEFADDELEKLIACSQFFQAEGVRYMIESNRRRCFQNCGSIIWQFNEPFPNVACTNLVDYYGVEKLAYYYVKNSYQAMLPSAKYSSLTYQPYSEFECSIYLTNELEEGQYALKCELFDADDKLIKIISFDGQIGTNTSIHCGNLKLRVPQNGTFFTLVLSASVNGSFTENLYLFLKDMDGKADREAIAAHYSSMMELLR